MANPPPRIFDARQTGPGGMRTYVREPGIEKYFEEVYKRECEQKQEPAGPDNSLVGGNSSRILPGEEGYYEQEEQERKLDEASKNWG